MPALGWCQSGRLRRDGDLVLIVRLGFELVGDERGRCRAIGDLDFGGQRESVCDSRLRSLAKCKIGFISHTVPLYGTDPPATAMVDLIRLV